MNFANALGFFVVGTAMCLLPLVAPGMFPHTAIDGSSGRALWTQLMGLVQVGVGVMYVLQHYTRSARAEPASAAEPAGVATAGDAAIEALVLGGSPVAPASASAFVEPFGSVTLHGEHAELWQAFHRALRTHGPARHLAQRILALSGSEPSPQFDELLAAGAAENADSNVVPFEWPEATAEVAGERVA